jgi:hypothetical protein
MQDRQEEMATIVDGKGNTLVSANDDGSYVLTTGESGIVLLPGTYPRQKLTAEFRSGRYYIVSYHQLGITINVLNSTSFNGRYGQEQNLAYWEPIFCPFRVPSNKQNVSWNSFDPATWGMNEWQYSEISSQLDWLFLDYGTSINLGNLWSTQI